MDNIIEAVLLFIHDNLDRRLTLKELSEIFDTNYCYLSSEFKKRTGKSLSKYLKFKKIELAKKLLENTQKEIKEISYDLGYKSLSNLYRDFKSIVGTPPKRYRRIYRGLDWPD